MDVTRRLRCEVLTALRSRSSVRAVRALSVVKPDEEVALVVQRATEACAAECDDLEHELGWRTPQTRGVWTCTGRPASRWDLPWAALGWASSLVVRPPWVITRDVAAHARPLA